MTNTIFIARSIVFYPGYFEDNCQELSDEIIIPAYHLNQIMEHYDDGEKLYVTMTNTIADKSILVAIGSPHSYDKNTIFAPQWILDLIDCNGNDDSIIKIQKADISEIPAATKIMIKPLDPIAFELDTRACFERAFMNLHSIKEGITIPIPVVELGVDYIMFAHIEKVEPASVSLIGGEVSVEFINDFMEDIRIPSAPTSTPELVSPILGPMITPFATPPNAFSMLAYSTVQMSAEERRRAVREAWAKRTQG